MAKLKLKSCGPVYRPMSHLSHFCDKHFTIMLQMHDHASEQYGTLFYIHMCTYKINHCLIVEINNNNNNNIENTYDK